MYISDLAAYLNIDFGSSDANPMYYAYKLYLNGRRVAGEVKIPAGVTKIPYCAFDGCDGIKSVEIPDSVTSIGSSAFSRCSGLTSVTMPDSLTSIGDDAFRDCSGLTSITIGSGLESIGGWAFRDCSGLKDVHIKDIAKWCEIDFGTSDSNPMYYADNLYVNDVLTTDLVIPNDMTSIGDYAFYNCDGLTSVTIGNSVTIIGSSAFYDCSRLAEITIPNSVTSIGDDAFSWCTGLTSVTIPDSVTSIGRYAFYYCSGLASVTIGNGLEAIGTMPFYNCNSLTSVNYNASKVMSDIFKYADYKANNNILLIVLGDNVKSIDTNAFTACADLKRIIIPKSVTEIEKAAFKDCTSLSTVEYGGSEAEWNEVYIGAENENLKNAKINYNSPLFATENIILTSPTVTSVEDETTRTFTVEIEQPVIGSYVYAVTYDANDMPLNISKVPLNLFEPTAVVVDKSDNDNYAKIFVWTDAMQPLTYVKSIELQ